MKKIMILLLLLLILTNCRSRKKTLQSSELHRTETVINDSSAVTETDSTAIAVQKKTAEKTLQEKKNEGKVEIEGSTDTAQDFDFHNVVDGDTISSVHISGNATFRIRNNWQNTDKKEQSTESAEDLNIVAQIARKAVAQKTIKDVAQEIKTKEVAVKSNGFSFQVYLIAGASALLLVLLWFGWRKFGGGIMEFFNRK